MIFDKNRWTSIVGTVGSIMSPTAIQYRISKIKSENAIGLIKPVLLECCWSSWYWPYLLCDLYSFDIFTFIFLRDLLFSETFIEMLKFKENTKINYIEPASNQLHLFLSQLVLKINLLKNCLELFRIIKISRYFRKCLISVPRMMIWSSSFFKCFLSFFSDLRAHFFCWQHANVSTNTQTLCSRNSIAMKQSAFEKNKISCFSINF